MKVDNYHKLMGKVVMNQKKIKSILAIGILLVSLAVAVAVPTSAEEFHSVYGYVYINNNLASSGVEVKITFDDGVETDITDANGYYQIDFSGPSHEWPIPGGLGYFSVVYNGNNYIPTDTKSVKILSDVIGYEIDIHIDTGAPQPPPPPPQSPPSPPGSTPTNEEPKADASASETTGIVGVPVNFDGLLSSGAIVNYTWDFGDGGKGYGWATTHVYKLVDTYGVTLTVRDDDGATDDDVIQVIISATPNIPPTDPDVDGPASGTKNTDYEYTAVSTDPDNDTIQYVFNWEEGDITTTDFLQNGTATMQEHNWSAAGLYTIEVKAYDNETFSGTTSYVVLIDVLYVRDIGYLIDDDANGIYDAFYSNSTGDETSVELQQNGTYLTDDDGDEAWDYIYDPQTNTLWGYSEGEEEAEEDYTVWYALFIGMVIVIILLFAISAVVRKK